MSQILRYRDKEGWYWIEVEPDKLYQGRSERLAEISWKSGAVPYSLHQAHVVGRGLTYIGSKEVED